MQVFFFEHRPCGAGYSSVQDRNQEQFPCDHQPVDRQGDLQHILSERKRDPDPERPAALRAHR